MIMLPRSRIPTAFDEVMYHLFDLVLIYLLIRLAMLVLKAVWVVCRPLVRPYFEQFLYREEVRLRWKYRRLIRERNFGSTEWDSLLEEAGTAARMNKVFGYESHPAVDEILNAARAVKQMHSPQILS